VALIHRSNKLLYTDIKRLTTMELPPYLESNCDSSLRADELINEFLLAFGQIAKSNLYYQITRTFLGGPWYLISRIIEFLLIL